MDPKQSTINGEQVVITVPIFQFNPKKPMSVVRVIHWAATLCIVTCLVASLLVDKMRKTTIWGLEFWKWTLLAMAVLSGLLVTNCLMEFLLYIIKRNSYLTKKLLQPIYNSRKDVQMFIWIVGILLTWVCLFTHGVRRPKIPPEIVNRVTWTLIVLLVGSIMWLFKTFSLKIYAAGFISGEYTGELPNPFFPHYILKALSEPPPTDPQRKEKFLAGVTTEAWHFLYVSNPGDVRVHFREIRRKTKILATEAATRLFGAEGYRYIAKEDLLKFVIQEEVDIVFPLFEGSETGRIDRQSWDNWVEIKEGNVAGEGYLTCIRNYAMLQGQIITESEETMRDMHEAHAPVRQLNKIMSGVLVIVCIIIWLLVMKLTNLQTLGLLLTAVGFTFGNTCMTIAKAAIFAFAVRPYRIGDHCVVEGSKLFVKEMDIFTTVFLNNENEKVYYPNSLLSEKSISNCDRRRDICIVEFEIDSSTPEEKIYWLKADIKRSIEENRRHWLPKHEIKVEESEKENKLKMTIYCYHTKNSQNFLKKNRRKSKLILEMKKIFHEHSVQFNLTPRPNRLSLSESKILAEKKITNLN